MAFLHTYFAIEGGAKLPPGASQVLCHLDIKIHFFDDKLFNGPHANLYWWFIYPEIFQIGARKPELVSFWHVSLYLYDIWVDYYVSWSANWILLLLVGLKLILVSHCKIRILQHKNQSNITWMRMLCTKLKVFPVCGRHLKRWVCSNANSRPIYRAFISSISYKTYNYILTSLECEQHLPNWNYFRFFVRHSYFRCDGDTYSDVNIIAIEKVKAENIDVADWILFYVS